HLSARRNHPASPGGLRRRTARRGQPAGRAPGDTGYPATLLDLAARGWFRLAEPEPGRLMCLLPPHPPRQPLPPDEKRAARHRAGGAAGRGEVPASALAEGFADGQAAFSEAFTTRSPPTPAAAA